MIYGLSLPPHVEKAIWERFANWSEGFKGGLRRDGVDGLLGEYETLIRSIETQSCLQGPGSSLQTGEDWRWCCGISYEYHNDISVRDALAVFVELLPPEQAFFRERLAALDARLQAFIDTGLTTAHWGNACREASPSSATPELVASVTSRGGRSRAASASHQVQTGHIG